MPRSTAADSNSADPDRVAAVRLLGRGMGSKPADLDLLARLLVPQNSSALQSASVAASGRSSDDRVAGLLLAGWKSHTPDLRGQVLDIVMSRSAWHRELLVRIEKKEVPPGQIDTARRQRLLQHKNESLRTLAARVFAGATAPDRQKVLKDYQDVVTMTGDRSRGKETFVKHCAACHRLGDVGHEVGPDLAVLTNKNAQFLLTSVLDPNSGIDERYVEYQAVTRAGRTFSGVLAGETATSITLKGQQGKLEVLLRSDIDELQSTGKSMMPEGLEREVSRQALADLIAYVLGQTTPPKKFPGNQPAIVQPVDGVLRLLATNCAIYGKDIIFEPEFRNIGYWSGLQDHVVWTVQLEREAKFDVYLDWACQDIAAGNPFILEGTQPALTGKVVGTGTWDRYHQAKIGSVALSAGTHRLIFRPAGDRLNQALIDLRGLVLVPPGQKPEFSSAAPPPGKDAAALARQLLDDKLARDTRQAIVNDHPQLAVALLKEMTADLNPGTPEEYRRIPWIWRVAIAAGKRNETEQVRSLLELSLPNGEDPLRDWQAVVIGGGIINGISLQGIWPRERIDTILQNKADLAKRWQRALILAATMTDNEKVPTGTRYDALRMIALDTWDRRGEQLSKYLAKGTNDELQMGAISGLADMDSPRVPQLLLQGMEHFSAPNRKLALDALLRNDKRVTTLLDAIEKGQVKVSQLAPDQVKTLQGWKDEALRARALKLLPK